jgi:tRNA 2-thiocytidine biosynthesis protein TtcA
MLAEWERAAPGRKETMFQALSRITPSHLLDPGLFDFKSLSAGQPSPPSEMDFEVEIPLSRIALQ